MKRSSIITFCFCAVAVIAVPFILSHKNETTTDTAFKRPYTYFASNLVSGPNNRKVGAFYMKNSVNYNTAVRSSNQVSRSISYDNYASEQNLSNQKPYAYLASNLVSGPNNRRIGAFYMKNSTNYNTIVRSSDQVEPIISYENYTKSNLSNQRPYAYLASHQVNGPNNRKMGTFYMRYNSNYNTALRIDNHSSQSVLYDNYIKAQEITAQRQGALYEYPHNTADNNIATRSLQESVQKQNDSSQTIFDDSAYENHILTMVNQERKKLNLKELTKSIALTEAARIKAYEMRDEDYFDHISPVHGSPSEMIADFGISSNMVAENIAKGQSIPQEVVSEWMDSSGHKANILNEEFTKTGISYATNSNGTTYWVQLFAKI